MSGLDVVAIDGPVGVGKSTVASRVAAALRFRHIDTGAMYRCVALRMVELAPADQTAERAASLARDLNIELTEDGRVLLDGQDVSDAIRDEEVSRQVALVADNREVREALVAKQRELGRRHPSVLEGRDIGTVVFPDARWKFYLDASPMVRVQRRAAQLEAMGRPAPHEVIRRNLLERDQRDRARPWGALSIAEDATIVDSTDLDEDAVVGLICALVRETPVSAVPIA